MSKEVNKAIVKRGRPLKWGTLKKRHYVMLTPKAWAWYQAQGGADYIEAQARK